MSLPTDPIEGRLDVLAYKICERVTQALEAHNPLLRELKLWATADKPIQQLIRQHVPNKQIKLPPEIANLLAERVEDK